MTFCLHRRLIQRRACTGRAGYECLRCGAWRPNPWYDGDPVPVRRVRPDEDVIVQLERAERRERAKLAVVRRYGEGL